MVEPLGGAVPPNWQHNDLKQDIDFTKRFSKIILSELLLPGEVHGYR
jgi:hypothetical protein